jgi:hypothetical protein
MNDGLVNKLTDELAAVVEQLADLQVSLHAIIQEKLGAMRRADTEAMLSVAGREGKMASQGAELDNRRRQVVSKLCQALGIPAGQDDGGITLRILAQRLDPAARDRLTKPADRLRDEMLKLAEANHVVELVSREMLTHFKTMFSAIMQDEDDAPTYSADGEVGPAAGARVLDAVG